MRTIRLTSRNSGVFEWHVRQRRLTQGGYKSKQSIRVPRKEWVIVEDTHVPLIYREASEKVGMLLNRPGRGGYHLLSQVWLYGLLWASGLLPNTETNLIQQNVSVMDSLEDLGGKIMNRTIRYSDEIVKAQKQWKDIYSYAPKSNGAKDYMELAKETACKSDIPMKSSIVLLQCKILSQK